MAREQHRLTVVSNRGPIQYAQLDGERVALRGGGGLVSALRGLIGNHEVTWIVCAISAEDHVVAAEQNGRALDETDAVGNAFKLHFADPAPDDFAAMYSTIANPLLWFIQHGLYASGEDPVISTDIREAWAGYRRYNAAVATEAAMERDCDALMIHDYQLALVPAMLREAGVDAPILHFTHIPWPEPEAWKQLPVDLRTELLHGLLGSDIVGFHTQQDVTNFLATCEVHLPQVTADRERACVRVTIDHVARDVHIRSYPISIDPAELGRIVEVVRSHGGITLIDEIYLGLSHDAQFGHSALALGDDIVSINSFSKYFNMTGWRLGWLVVPEQLTPVLERLAQNLFICASTVAQQAIGEATGRLAQVQTEAAIHRYT